MEEKRPFTDIKPFPNEKKAEVDRMLEAAVKADDRKILVLDDDPTGVQTVHDISVYTDWSVESLQSGLEEENKCFFVLTNSRGLTAEQTTTVHREIIRNAVEASRKSGKSFIMISRSDSTLRGHYPLETRLIAEGLEELLGTAVDGEILFPYFREGGRYTLDDTHYVRYGDELVPAAQTEFAADKTFGYTHSDLKEYIEEKTEGAFSASGVLSISIEELRSLDIERIAEKLMAVKGFGKVIVNSCDDYDVKVFCIALYKVLSAGKTFCYRSAAAFVKELANISDKPLLTREEMVPKERNCGGIVVVGSHTAKTTKQLEQLEKLEGIIPIEMNSDLVIEGDALERETQRIVTECEKWIVKRKTPVVYTKRKLLTIPNDTPEEALIRSVKISDAVQSVVGNLKITPAFIIAKGGITSSDVGTRALKVKRAKVLGQIRPGIPVWQTGEESRFPGVAYVIFPGNVGNDETLLEAAEILMNEKSTN